METNSHSQLLISNLADKTVGSSTSLSLSLAAHLDVNLTFAISPSVSHLTSAPVFQSTSLGPGVEIQRVGCNAEQVPELLTGLHLIKNE